MDIGSRIKELRNSMHISQQELADKLGVDRSTIGKYETNTRIPEVKMLIQLAKFFDVSTDFLLGLSEY
jgi:transcriptional regulator with XRE-family HTH domain